MSNEMTGAWYDEDQKGAAVYKVLRYLANHPEAGIPCVGNDNEARKLFEDKGGISVPVANGARVIFFAPGEQALQSGASVVLEVPASAIKDVTDDELKKFVLGNYPYWPPQRD